MSPLPARGPRLTTRDPGGRLRYHAGLRATGRGRRLGIRASGLFLAVTLVLLSSSPVAAQRGARQGFWWGVGVGAAYVDMDCRGCDELPDSIPYGPGGGFHVSLAGGGTVASRLLVGASVTTSARAGDNRDATLLGWNATAQYYPTRSGRLFLRGGGGLSVGILAGGGTLIEAPGLGGHIDVGVDLWQWGNRVLAPYAGVATGWKADGSESVVETEPLNIGPPRTPRAFYLGASIMWY